jgi:hypothetical protein
MAIPMNYPISCGILKYDDAKLDYNSYDGLEREEDEPDAGEEALHLLLQRNRRPMLVGVNVGGLIIKKVAHF